MRRTTSRSAFTAVRTEGGILPAELLERLAGGDKDLPGLAPGDYHLGPHERLGEAVNRSWSRLLGAWASFRDARAKAPEGDPATRITRERWLLPLFQELGYGRLLRSKALEVDGKSFALSHLWHHSPIHLLGAGLSLDHRARGVAGAAASSPHGLVQELLNRSDDHLWGFVANGLVLRILRDHHSLTRQAYVEFDLESMFAGEQYGEFLLLWLVAHQSRVEAEKPEECWLERWFQLSRDEGVRALDKLRDGVQTAIEKLGQGFLRQRSNRGLQEALETGELDGQEYYRELLRLVYRLIFLFVAEDRDALLDPTATEEARDRYLRFYATRHLRQLADRHRGGTHGDLWHGLRLVMEKLGEGCAELALPALGSFLWRGEAMLHLVGCELGNADLLAAIRTLCTIEDRGSRYPVNWRNIGSEELGSIYESLLELHPRLHREGASFELATAPGHERKTTGSYYTPASLVDCLLDSALDPVLDEAAAKPEPEAAILDLKVCDPACGSGHFLVAAARRIATRLAAVRSGEDEPSPEMVQEALRDVVGHCLYGVDINPMAVELCKVSLWMEAIEPGKPLSFLDHHIQVGNSLLGATPALLDKGIPDEAFRPIEGDDKAFCAELRKYNKTARETRQTTLFDLRGEPWMRLGDLSMGLLDLDELPDDTVERVRRKEKRWEEILASQDYETSRMWADAWCAAFVWEKVDDPERPYPISEQDFRKIEQNPKLVDFRVGAEIRRLAEEYRFFHWHLAFPQIFGEAEAHFEDKGSAQCPGGFDVVLGNPPWENKELQEKQFFATRNPEIARAQTAAKRKKLIAALENKEPDLYVEFQEATRLIQGFDHIVRRSGAFRFTATGRLNTYALFAELSRTIAGGKGNVGIIIPTGIATDNNLRLFFNDLIETCELKSIMGFENEEFLFPGIANVVRFCLLTLSKSLSKELPSFAFYIRRTSQLQDEERFFTLSAGDIRLVNPNTKTCPIFRTKHDAELTKSIYSRIPIMSYEDRGENPWGIDFKQGLFNMASDSHFFITEPNRGCVPLYEGKFIWHFDHRFSSYDLVGVAKGKGGRGLPMQLLSNYEDSSYSVSPRYWVPGSEFRQRTDPNWKHRWFLSFRDVTSAKLERTSVAAIIPYVAAGHKAPLIFPRSSPSVRHTACLLGNLNSLVFDYVIRQKIGGTSLSFFVLKQAPLLPPENYGPDDIEFIAARVIELTYCADDVRAFAVDAGYIGKPFRWNHKRRRYLRAELDAYFALLYGLTRDELAYILDPVDVKGVGFPGETFRVLKEKEAVEFGDYRTKLRILDIYDAMQRAIDTGEPYQTLLDPPPADPRVAHPPRDEEPAKAATVLPFPSTQPEDMTYPSSPPELMEVAEPQTTYDDVPQPLERQPEPAIHDEILVTTSPAERILRWLEEHPGWHARADLVADLDLATPEWNVAIRDLVDSGEVERKGHKRGTRYRLAGSSDTAGEPEWTDAEAAVDPASATPADKIFTWLKEHPGWHSRAEILDALSDVSTSDWNQAIRELVSFGEVERTGEKRGTRYRVAAKRD